MRIKKSRLFAVIFLHFDFIAVVLIICFCLIHALEMSFFSFYLNFTLQRFRSFHLIVGPVIDCSRCRCICAVLIGAYCETVLPSASVMVPAFERDVMVLSPVTVHVESLSITTLQYPSPPFPALDSSLTNAPSSVLPLIM